MYSKINQEQKRSWLKFLEKFQEDYDRKITELIKLNQKDILEQKENTRRKSQIGINTTMIC